MSNVTWATAVKDRDNWTCQECGVSAAEVGSKRIHAHHIVSPFCGGKNTLENGITVCRKCHWKIYHANGTRNIAENSTKKIKVTFLTSEEKRKALKQLEIQTGRNLSNLINFILDDWFLKTDLLE